MSSEPWQQELAQSYSSVTELKAAGIISLLEAQKLNEIGERFQIRLPRYYAALMDCSEHGKALCPIRKQALPSLEEEDPTFPEWAQELSLKAFGRKVPWTTDPIGDVDKMAAPRLTHRYENRAILHLSSLCAMYCRFCFRKSHLNDDSRTLYEGRLDSTFEYLKSHSEIRELILTGGDPLSLPDPWLKKFLKDLNALPNLKHIRIHSRMSATLPSRLTENLARYLSDQNFSVALVSHFNHPIELTDYAMSRLKHFKQNGISLYNQSVLLKGINDSEQTLFELFQNLYENGIIPFYLHHPDWTIGTFHFHISIEKGKDLMRALQGKLSGPAMPHYVLDIPGGDGKVPLLDETRVKKIKTISDVDSNLGGALYEIQPPYTLESSASSLYADFWRQFPNPR